MLLSALNSNRYVPKNLCSEFALSGFESLGVDPYYDTTVESRETIKARLKNLDNFSNPIKTTGQSARPAADKFNTFSNQNSFIENEPRSGNFNFILTIIIETFSDTYMSKVEIFSHLRRLAERLN